jgi:predicted N-acyltransferase
VNVEVIDPPTRTVADRFDQLSPALANAWDSLLGPGDFFLSRDWLRFTESTGGANHYLVYSRGTRLLAATVVNRITEAAPAHVRVDAALARTGEAATDLLPSIHVGGRNVRASRLLCTPDLPTGMGHWCAADAACWAERQAGALGARSVSALYTKPGDHLCETLRVLGWRSFSNTPNSTLVVDFDDFDGYLGTFRTKKRGMIKRERARIRELGIVCGSEPLSRALIEECAPLIAANQVKYGAAQVPTRQVADWLGQLLRLLPHRFEAICARDPAGHLLGVTTFASWEKDLYLDQVGFDYEAKGTTPLYFELVFYQTVEIASSRGAARIDFAVGLDDVKRSRGCVLQARDGYYKRL